MQAQDLSDWIVRAKRLVASVTGLDGGRVLAVLVGYDWNVSLALKDFVEDPTAALRAAQLTSTAGGDEVSSASIVQTPQFFSPPPRAPPQTMAIIAMDDEAINLDDLTFDDNGDGGDGETYVALDELRAVM